MEEAAVYISDQVLDRVRSEGYAVVEGFLSGPELASARNGMFEEFPSPEVYFADPAAHTEVVRHPFAGLRVGPFRSWDLTRLAFHPELVDAAERFCGSADLELYKIEAWGKYSGAIDYDQTHHRDYGNHSLVVPRSDGRWPQLTSFLLLSDVSDDDGPTCIISRSIGDEIPLVPQHAESDAALREHETPIIGPAGSLLLYSTDVLHRGSAMTGTGRSRFSLLADFAQRGNPWMGKVSWPGQAMQTGFADLMVRTSPRERDLFGFPPPGHAYWNEQTLRDVEARWPGIDLSPYRG